MVKSPAPNTAVRKALDAITAIEAEARRKKMEQLDGLREALRNIDQRIDELAHQRQQVEFAITKITGKIPETPPPRRSRKNSGNDDLPERVVRWLESRAGEWFTSSQLQAEFVELKDLPSIAAFLKNPIEGGVVVVDRNGGPRNTKYARKT